VGCVSVTCAGGGPPALAQAFACKPVFITARAQPALAVPKISVAPIPAEIL